MPTKRRAFGPAAPEISRAQLGRPISDLVQQIERRNPGLVAARGVSSAALRAGDMIRAMRKAANLSQSALALSIRVSQARISELEAGTGSQGPTWDVMERIAEVCHVRLGWVPRDAVVEASGIYRSLAARGMPAEAMKITEIGDQTYVELENVEEGVNVVLQTVAVSGG